MNELNFPENWPAPKDYLIEMGRISILWGCLESTINVSISKLIGFDEILDWRSAVLTAHSNFQQRLDIFSTLCEQLQHEYPHLSEYKVVIEKIKKVQLHRNQYAHNPISLNEKTGRIETTSLSARGKLKTKIQEVELEDLKNVSAELHVVMLDLHHLITQVRYPPFWER